MTDSLNLTGVFRWFPSNSSYVISGFYDITPEDACFIAIAAFIIFTMQTGFALVECGMVSQKNQVNIMMKNVVDVTIGGTSFWMFGYALAYGRGIYSNWFCGLGDFFLDQPVTDVLMGQVMSAYFYQMSFATTSTTIVSGAIAERVNFKGYCLFSFTNSITYGVAAGWIWSERGFLHNLGGVEIAGSGPIHITGGIAALVATVMIGPRLNRFDKGIKGPPMGNAKDACVGLFILWWGWIAFNVASTYGVSGRKWEYAIRGGVMTTLGTFGAGFFSIVYSYIKNKGKPEPFEIINGILASLVALNCGCPFFRAWEAIVIGAFAAFITIITVPMWCKLGVDDPIAATSVHLLGGVVGLLSVGLFAESPDTLSLTGGRSGLFKSGEWYLLGIQSFSMLCYALWSLIASTIIVSVVNFITPLRMTPEDERLGADFTEHSIVYENLQPLIKNTEIKKIVNETIETNNEPLHLHNININDRARAEIYKPYNSITGVVGARPRHHTYRENYAFEHDDRRFTPA